AIATVLRLHPAFVPGYVRVGVSRTSERQGRLWLEDSDGFHEGDSYSWYALLAGAAHPGLDAMVQAGDPHARRRPATPRNREPPAWDVIIEGEAGAVPPEVAMITGTNTASLTFRAGAPSS